MTLPRRYKFFEITTTIGCACNCDYCPQDVLLCKYKKNNPTPIFRLSMSDFKRAIENLPHDMEVCFAGMSEPFGNPDAVNMLLYAHQKGHKISVYTSLNQISLEQMRQISKIPYTAFVIHLPDVDRMIHIQADQNYIDKIKLVLDLNLKNMEFMCIGTPMANVEELIRGKYPIDIVSPHDRSCNVSEEPEMIHILKRRMNRCEPFICDRRRETERCFTSPVSFENFVMLPDGRVLLCCNDYGMKHILGNIFEQKYETLLKSSEYRKIQAQMKGKNGEDSICRTCTMAYPLSRWRFWVLYFYGKPYTPIGKWFSHFLKRKNGK